MPSLKIIGYCLLSLLLLNVSACSWLKKTSVEKDISAIAIDRQTKLDTRHLFPLTMQGEYVQKITTTVKQQHHTFSVYLMITPQQLQATAFNDIAGRLYQLTWQAGHIRWVQSRHIPKALKPEYILADFLLANLPLPQLKDALKGARVYEKINGQNKVRVIISQLTVLRTIQYSKPLGSLWQHVIINNPQLDYTLDIQTAPAS